MAGALVDAMGVRLTLSEQAIAATPMPGAVVILAGDGSAQALDASGALMWSLEGLHEGALLCASAGPKGAVLTGGEDGRVLALGPDGRSRVLASFPKRWVEALAAAPVTGLVAAGVGKQAVLVDFAGAGAGHAFDHETTVAGLAFEPNGRRLAATHRDGVTISWATNPASRRKTLSWKGAHQGVVWSEGAKYLVTTMQENALHGWRLQDGQHFRMTGYPAKVRAMGFSADGRVLVTAGAPEVVCWPFDGPNGPINRSGAVIGEMGAPVTAVACHPEKPLAAIGADDGEVALFRLDGQGRPVLAATPSGARVTALAWFDAGRGLAFGDEGGGAGIIDFRAAMAG